MWNLIVCPERVVKQGMVMDALAAGMPNNGKFAEASPLEPFVCAGQLWAVERMVPQAIAAGTPFWVVDNGYYMQSGKGKHETGHWEFTYCGLEPIILNEPDYTRFPYDEHVLPWNYNRNGEVLIGFPGVAFGRMIGMDMKTWISEIVGRVRFKTRRKIRTRDKWSKISLEKDLKNVSVLVTHSSHVAIDAVRRGIPAIVAPSSPAAAVCSHSLDDIERPLMPDRRQWWASLMSQQFTLAEMRSGLAWHWMQKIMEQVDGTSQGNQQALRRAPQVVQERPAA